MGVKMRGVVAGFPGESRVWCAPVANSGIDRTREIALADLIRHVECISGPEPSGNTVRRPQSSKIPSPVAVKWRAVRVWSCESDTATLIVVDGMVAIRGYNLPGN